MTPEGLGGYLITYMGQYLITGVRVAGSQSDRQPQGWVDTYIHGSMITYMGPSMIND